MKVGDGLRLSPMSNNPMENIGENMSQTDPHIKVISRAVCAICGKDITDKPKYSTLNVGELQCEKCYFKK